MGPPVATRVALALAFAFDFTATFALGLAAFTTGLAELALLLLLLLSWDGWENIIIRLYVYSNKRMHIIHVYILYIYLFIYIYLHIITYICCKLNALYTIYIDSRIWICFFADVAVCCSIHVVCIPGSGQTYTTDDPNNHCQDGHQKAIKESHAWLTGFDHASSSRVMAMDRSL